MSGASMSEHAGGCKKPADMLALLLLDGRQRRDLSKPWLRRAAPDLRLGRKLVALAHGAEADVVVLGSIAESGRVNRRTTAGTERLHAFGATIADLDVDGRFAR